MLPLSRPEAFVYLDDAIEKVRYDYVDTVSAMNFIAHGTENCISGCNNEKFLQKNISYADTSRVAEVRRRSAGNIGTSPSTDRMVLGRLSCNCVSFVEYELNLSPTAMIMELVLGGCNSLDHEDRP